MTRTSLGLRLRVLGENPRAAEHAGLHTRRLIVLAFMASGALIGLAGAVEILGIWGSFRADFNPAFGLIVIPLVFLARLNAIGAGLLVAAFAVIQIGGESAARKSEVSSDILLALVGLILLFMAVTEWLRARRRARPPLITPGLAEAVGAGTAPRDDTRPAQPGVPTG
jgi:general nucleoside transport system permease protein